MATVIDNATNSKRDVSIIPQIGIYFSSVEQNTSIDYCINSSNQLYATLYRINKGAFAVLEEEEAEEGEEGGGEDAVSQSEPAELPDSEGAELEGLNYGGEGVQGHYRVELRVRDCAHRVNDGGSVHPEAYEDGEEVRKVTVFGGHRGDDKAEAEGRGREERHEDGEEQEIPVRVDFSADEGIDYIDYYEEAQLDREAEEVGKEL